MVAGHRCEVADIAVDDAEQRDNRGLVRRDLIEVAHCASLGIIARMVVHSPHRQQATVARGFADVIDGTSDGADHIVEE